MRTRVSVTCARFRAQPRFLIRPDTVRMALQRCDKLKNTISNVAYDSGDHLDGVSLRCRISVVLRPYHSLEILHFFGGAFFPSAKTWVRPRLPATYSSVPTILISSPMSRSSPRKSSVLRGFFTKHRNHRASPNVTVSRLIRSRRYTYLRAYSHIHHCNTLVEILPWY